MHTHAKVYTVFLMRVGSLLCAHMYFKYVCICMFKTTLAIIHVLFSVCADLHMCVCLCMCMRMCMYL